MKKLIHSLSEKRAFEKGAAALLLIFLCLAGAASGQTQSGTPYVPSSPSKFHLGLGLAPNASFGMSRDYAHYNDGLLGQFGYRFIFDIMFTDTYAISTGVNVYNTGGNVIRYALSDAQSELDVVEAIEWEQRLQYVELPVTFKMRTREIGYTTFTGQFGAGFGLNVRAEADERRWATWTRDAIDPEASWTLTGNEPGEEWTRVILDDRNAEADLIKLFRPSMIIGLGMERRFTGSTALLVGLDYSMGLGSVYTDRVPEILRTTDDRSVQFANDEPINVNMNGKSAALTLTIGVMF